MASTSSAKAEGGSGASCGGEAITIGPPDHLSMYGGIKKPKKERGCTAKERISKMPPSTAGKRSSIYRGVTRHRWTGRYEAHLWDKSTWNQNQNKKGKQVYLGAYDDEEAAARAYDLAALKYWGPGTLINFPVTDYTRDLDEMQNVSREDYLASLRRKSSGFSRGISKYRPLSSINYGAGDNATTEHDYVGGFCIDRKIDLSNYIKWWGVNKSAKETKGGGLEEIGSECKEPELAIRHTEPYEMPRLGVTTGRKEEKRSRNSALGILSCSEAFRNFQENALTLRKKEDDENGNKNIIHKMEQGKALENPAPEGGTDRPGVAFGSCGGLNIQRNMYVSNPFISGELLSNNNTVNTLTDPVLWTPLVPALPLGSAHTDEVTKNEPSSDYGFFQAESS